MIKMSVFNKTNDVLIVDTFTLSHSVYMTITHKIQCNDLLM